MPKDRVSRSAHLPSLKNTAAAPAPTFQPMLPAVIKKYLAGAPADVPIAPLLRTNDAAVYCFKVNNGSAQYTLNATEYKDSYHFESSVAEVRRPRNDFLRNMLSLNCEIQTGKVGMTPSPSSTNSYEIVYGMDVPKAGLTRSEVAERLVIFDSSVPQLADIVARNARNSNTAFYEKVERSPAALQQPSWKVLGLPSGEDPQGR